MNLDLWLYVFRHDTINSLTITGQDERQAATHPGSNCQNFPIALFRTPQADLLNKISGYMCRQLPAVNWSTGVRRISCDIPLRLQIHNALTKCNVRPIQTISKQVSNKHIPIASTLHFAGLGKKAMLPKEMDHVPPFDDCLMSEDHTCHEVFQ